MINKNKQVLFVVPYNPILGSSGPQGPKNVSQPLINLISASYDVVLVVVSADENLNEISLRTVFPRVKYFNIVRPLKGWSRRFARLKFVIQGLPASLADGLAHELPILLRKYATTVDIVHFEYFTLVASIAVVQPFADVQLHCHDAYSLYQKRLLAQSNSFFAKFLAFLRFLSFRNLENRFIAKASVALTVSPIDRQYLAQHGLSNIHYLPPALQPLDLNISPDRNKLKPELLCIVSAIYQQSQANELLEFFRNEFPRLVQQAGGVLPVTLFGKSSRQLQIQLMPYVKVEAVEFIEDYFSFISDRNWICFYPQRAGAGLHTKLRDIMAAKVPVVGFAEIMDAFSGTNGEHYFSCNDIVSVANSISIILSNPDVHERVALGGFRLLSERFSPETVLRVWESLSHCANSDMESRAAQSVR